MAYLIKKSGERAQADQGWLKAWHTFSFPGWEDKAWPGLKSFRVLDEECIQGGHGLGVECHQDVEILTYMMEGTLQHADSMNNLRLLHAGEAQCLTAGTGVSHSETNASIFEECRFYQILIVSKRHGLTPSYAQKPFSGFLKQQHKVLLASPDGRYGSLRIHQRAEVWLQRLKVGEGTTVPVRRGKAVWVQVTAGAALLSDGQKVEAGDGILSYEDLSFKTTMDLEMLECVV